LKKGKARPGELRAEDERSDFVRLVFRNSSDVNKALHSLVDVAQKATTRAKPRVRSARPRRARG
jgi:hypothetical protein